MISFAPCLGYQLRVPLNDLFGWVSPDISIIFPSFDVIGSFWRCILRPIFMPQSQESSWAKADDFVAPKISKTVTALRQPLSTLNGKQNLVRKTGKFKSRPSPSKIVIRKRLNRNTAGKFIFEQFQK